MCSSRRKALLAAASWAAREQPLNARKDDLRNPDPESGLLRETRAPPVCPRAAWRPVRVLRGPRRGGGRGGRVVLCELRSVRPPCGVAARSQSPSQIAACPRFARTSPLFPPSGRRTGKCRAEEPAWAELRSVLGRGGVSEGRRGEGLQAESGGGRARCPSGNFEGRVTRMLPGAAPA